MICNSSGIAPFRAFLQHQHRHPKDDPNNPRPFNRMVLFFGARHRSKDYIFKDEIEQLASECTLTAVFEAFSRDDIQKVYVQDILKTKRDMVYRMIVKGGGSVYLCGSNAMIQDCLDTLRDLLREIEGSEESGDILFQEMKDANRIVFEGWG